MSAVTIDPILPSVWLIAILAIFTGGILYWIYIPWRSLEPQKRRTLLALRVVAALVFLLAMLRPSLVRTDKEATPATLAILVDGSRSMTLADGTGKSRWESQQNVIRTLSEGLSGSDAQLRIRWYAYGEKVTPFAATPDPQWVAGPPAETQTDLGQALRTAIAGATGQPLAGVILIGDGTSTRPESNPADVARSLSALDIPLWTIPIGPRSRDQELRDVAVEEVPEQFRLFAKNAFRLRATLVTRGMIGREIPVNVTLVDAQEHRQELASRLFRASESEGTIAVEFDLVAPEPGSYRLEVSAAAQAGEILTDNNQQIAFLDVREGGGRILFVEGQPRLEQLFLRRAINESPDFELTFQLLAETTQSRWPIDLGLEKNLQRYDVFILGDVDAAALGDQNLEVITRAVDAGSGLLMIGGRHAFDLGGYAQTPLADVLPIRMDAARRVGLLAEPPAGAMIAEPVKLQPRKPHPITQLAAGEGNRQAWDALKPLLGVNRFSGLKVAPAVEVLLESTRGDPVLVVGQYGRGRVAIFGGDTTWQWWRQQRSDLHRRYWRQTILWLLAREAKESGKVWIEMPTRRFHRTEGSSFTAGVQQGEKAFSGTLKAEVIDRDGKPLPLEATPAPPSPEGSPSFSPAADEALIGGVIPELPAGVYHLRVSPRESNAEAEAKELVFQVLDTDAELSRPIADIGRLEQLAALTDESGGAAFAPDQTSALLEQLLAMRREAELPVVHRYRLGEGPVGGWTLMLVMLLLLSSDWYLRRRWALA